LDAYMFVREALHSTIMYIIIQQIVSIKKSIYARFRR
jgi:hypothetical protein